MKASKNQQKQNDLSAASGKYRPVAVIGMVATLIVGLGIAAYATNNLFHGHVTKTDRASQTGPATVVDKSSGTTSKGAPPQLLDKYGTPANSPKVAAEIKKAEGMDGIDATKTANRHTLGEQKADAYEKLERGILDQANPPPQIEVIRRGLVPPGMSQEQAAMLYNSLPNNLKMPYTPQPGSPEWLARATREPADPTPSLANGQMIEQYMRQRSGPGGIVPLQVDHAWLLKHGKRTATGWVVTQDHQMSLIPAQYSYDSSQLARSGASAPRSIREMTDSSGNIVYQQSFDPYGNATQLQGSGPAPDFGYQDYYVHARSGLLLTRTRAYSPILGRFLNRDRIGERGGVNLFAYVGNNPIEFSDPSGEVKKISCDDKSATCENPGAYGLPKDRSIIKNCFKNGDQLYFVNDTPGQCTIYYWNPVPWWSDPANNGYRPENCPCLKDCP